MNRFAEKILDKINNSQGVLITSPQNIRYFSGFTSEDCMIYISHSVCAILTDFRYAIQANEQAKGYEVITKETLEFLRNVQETEILIEEEHMTLAREKQLREKLTDKELIPSQKLISSFRQVKDIWEIEKIKQAEQLGDNAFEYILDYIKPGMTEEEVSLELEFYMRRNGASGLAFETICASGIRSAMPHGTASKKPIKKGELLTLDFGCVLDGYCSDMTRTVVIDHISDTRQEEIYNIVLKAQKEALKYIKAGMKCAEADSIARKVIADAGYGECFGHSLGHSLGLQVHELPNLSPKSTDVLVAGNVVSVEPGIYIEGFGGVRIEDIAAITDNGMENLTCSPKELIIIK